MIPLGYLFPPCRKHGAGACLDPIARPAMLPASGPARRRTGAQGNPTHSIRPLSSGLCFAHAEEVLEQTEVLSRPIAITDALGTRGRKRGEAIVMGSENAIKLLIESDAPPTIRHVLPLEVVLLLRLIQGVRVRFPGVGHEGVPFALFEEALA